MRRPVISLRKNLVALMALALVFPVVSARTPPQADKTQSLTKARDAYYNLRRLGLIEFRANVQPNWDVLLAGVEQKATAINLLAGLHFSVSIDPASKYQLTHRTDEPVTNPKTAEDLGRIVRRMDAALKQFFATWSVFMLTSPFPAEGSEYDVSRAAGQIRFHHKEGATDVIAITDRDFMMVEMQVAGPTHNGWLKPVFEKTANGFMLKSFEATTVAESGQRITSLKTKLEYAEHNGLQLLQKVNVDTIYNGSPAQMEWLFTDYQVKRR